MKWTALIGLLSASKLVLGGNVANLYIHNPSDICDVVAQRSGYVQFGANKEYFFWMFDSRSQPTSDPTVMLTGGPGGSSMAGLLLENGPCKVNPDGASTRKNDYSWTTRANVMWVDQPLGTGFSKGKWDFNEDDVAEDMYQFLLAFFNQMPQYNTRFYVMGESYAGQYVPAVTHRIFEGNSMLAKGGDPINLRGMAIGNGLTHPGEQFEQYSKRVCNNGRNAPMCVAVEESSAVCNAALTTCSSDMNAGCKAAMTDCAASSESTYLAAGLTYDVHMDNEVRFLNDATVQQKLGVDIEFSNLNLMVTKALTMNLNINYHKLISPMLANGIDVLIYSGENDEMSNWSGNENWVKALEWDGKSKFDAHTNKKFVVNDKIVGARHSAMNLHFLRVFGAGRRVATDQPEAALGMLDHLVSGDFAVLV